MFHDRMHDLYGFLNLPGFKSWHKHQYLSESEEFLNMKHYFMSTHNKLLNTDDPGQPEMVIPDTWYKYTRLDISPQIIKQYTELSFEEYKTWEEDTKKLYEECSKSLHNMGQIGDAQEVNRLIQDVTEELNDLYEIMIELKSTNYDVIHIFDIQHKLQKKYK